MKMKNVKIDDIVVEGRFRQDLGDIGSLAKDIKENGLINPITISDDNKLIAGERRLTAMSLNGEKYIHLML